MTTPWPPVQRPVQDIVRDRLLEHRIVLLHGALDGESATQAAATLLTLDAESGEPVDLRLDCPEADLGAAMLLADTIDLMRAPVHLTCVGDVAGPVVVLLTAADRVEATPNARFRLTEPRLEANGSADQVAAVVAQHARLLDQLCARLAERTGRTTEQVRADLRPPGRFLTAQEALAYGLVDRVAVKA